ncbi:MAG: hypothetical protein HYR96_11305 [Deltaproteobacteria bacterium]|nr:hypothetical protein [Deltaproteobacteria bacterium]MBI3293282.1 hypothetical protein [Deltaproteobacteria bacterium]
MKRTATISTVIDANVKKAATEYCKKNGLKLQYLVERGLIEQLEDAIDLEAFRSRREEEMVPLETVLKGLKR